MFGSPRHTCRRCLRTECPADAAGRASRSSNLSSYLTHGRAQRRQKCMSKGRREGKLNTTAPVTEASTPALCSSGKRDSGPAPRLRSRPSGLFATEKGSGAEKRARAMMEEEAGRVSNKQRACLSTELCSPSGRESSQQPDQTKAA